MLYADKVRAKLSLGLLCAVTGTCLLALCHACGIECAANDVVTNAGKVFNPAAADKNGRVLLKVVAFAGNVYGTFLLVGKAHTGNLSYSGVRLFRSRGGNRKAHAALLGAVVKYG